MEESDRGQFYVLSQYLHGYAEKNYEKPPGQLMSVKI